MSAFSAASTTSQRAGSTHHAAYAANERLPAAAASNPFYDNVRQNLELSQGITERIPLKIGREAKARVHELPFAWLREIGRWAAVDGEGSDGETSASSGEEETSGMEDHQPPQHVHFNAKEKLKAREGIAEGAEALAMQFYRIELGEQRRLMGVMEHHSRESGGPSQAEPESPTTGKKDNKKQRRKKKKADKAALGGEEFPFSITAGIEKGAKNRYRNIWPFEHARVRLASRTHAPPPLVMPVSRSPKTTRPRGNSLMLPPISPDSSDDYVNASYVQPLGTNKRYIATQGPLPETFTDFWTLVWEQNVHVIVMLTREVEGATVKSGNYWAGEKFGPLRLKLVSEEGALGKQGADGGADGGGGYFNLPAPSRSDSEFVGVPDPDALGPQRPSAHTVQKDAPGEDADVLDDETTIRRVLELTHTRYPRAPPRRIVQLQYLAWPDMNVPASTGSILRLIKQVEREVARGVEADARLDSDEALAGGSNETLTGSSGSGSGDFSSGSGPGSPGNESTASGSELDAKFGIQRRARQPPVLLHCSAGVGRTGGFIAVDAVLDGIRREMLEMRERAERGSAEAELSSESEMMDVDENGGGVEPGLVMDLGGVHVPVAGEAPMEMDIDERTTWPSDGPKNPVTRWEEPQPRTQKHTLDSIRSPPPAMGLSPSASSSAVGGPSPFPLSPPPPARRRTPESSPGASGGMAAMSLDRSPSAKRPVTPRIRSFNLGGAPAFSFNKDAGFNFSASGSSLEKEAGSSSTAGGDQDMLSHDAQPTQAGYPTHAGQAPALGPSFVGHRTKSGGSSGESSGAGSGSPFPSASVSVVGSSGENGGRSRRESSTGGGLAGVDGMRTQSPYPTMLGQQGNVSSGPPLYPFPAHSSSASPMPPSGLATRDESPASASGGSMEGESSSGAGTGSSAFGLPGGSTSATSASAKASNASLVKSGSRGSPDGADANTSAESMSGGSPTNARSRTSGSPDAVASAGPDITMNTQTAEANAVRAPASESKSGPSDPSSRTEHARVRATPTTDTNLKAAEAASERARVPLTDKRRTTPPTLDYAPPRALHDNAYGPVALSGLDEPIRRVLEDMREQRMSLCQSLRQYVFVHRAVLEGALALVDAERARGGLAIWDDRGSGPHTPSGSGGDVVEPVATQLSGSGKGKRGASPTELAAPSEAGQPLGRRASAKRRKPRGSSSEDDRDVVALQ
ncbi:phosphatases II [Peniophora sp. CONT]|nr:phosphatases II [Peniophora sp. CONT]